MKTNEKLEWRSEHRAASAQALAKNVSSKSLKKDKSKIVGEFLDYVTHDQSNKQCKLNLFNNFSLDLKVKQGKHFGENWI